MRPASLAHETLKFARAYLAAAIVGSAITSLAFWWEQMSTLFRYPHHPPNWATSVCLNLLAGTFTGVMMAIVATPIFIAALLLVRRLQIWRPLADAVAGIIFGFATLHEYLEARIDLAKHDPAPMTTDMIYQLAAGIVLGGVAGGLAYWLLAGRPHPPYQPAA